MAKAHLLPEILVVSVCQAAARQTAGGTVVYHWGKRGLPSQIPSDRDVWQSPPLSFLRSVTPWLLSVRIGSADGDRWPQVKRGKEAVDSRLCPRWPPTKKVELGLVA